jgi:hypothetical protein
MKDRTPSRPSGASEPVSPSVETDPSCFRLPLRRSRANNRRSAGLPSVPKKMATTTCEPDRGAWDCVGEEGMKDSAQLDSARQSGKWIGEDDREKFGARQGISLTAESDYAEMISVLCRKGFCITGSSAASWRDLALGGLKGTGHLLPGEVPVGRPPHPSRTRLLVGGPGRGATISGLSHRLGGRTPRAPPPGPSSVR